MFRRSIQTTAAISGLLLVTLLTSWHAAHAGPITGGPGVAPFTKLGVYQGVISVVPGGVNDSVLEIGNAGRDIASTGGLYLRPGTVGGQDGNTHLVSGSLCFGSGTGDCRNTWTGLGGSGSTPPLDTVLATGNTGNAKTILLNNQIVNAQSLGVTSGASNGSGTFAFIAPNLNGGSYSDVTRGGDSGLFFSQGGGFTISGWNQVAGTVKGIRVAGGTLGNAALAVNNGLSGTGGSNDAIAAYANATAPSAAVYAQQNNAGGYAGYFSGAVTVSGTTSNPILFAQQSGTGHGVYATLPSTTTTSAAVYAESNSASGWAGYFDGRVFSSNSVTANTFVLGTVSKATWTVQVCLINGGACLGQYVGSSGTSAADFRYYYNVPPNTVSNVLVYSGPNFDFCSPGSQLVSRSLTGNSKWDTSGCSGTEYVLGGSVPYGSGNACRADVGATLDFQSVRTSSGCSNQTLTKFLFQITTPLNGPGPHYELR